MDTGDLQIKFRVDQSSSSRDMPLDRPTHRRTDKAITILCSPTGAE